MSQAIDPGTKQAILRQMEETLDRYSVLEHAPRQNDAQAPPEAKDGEVVLLTGSTGRLGSYILAQLIVSRRVRKVYALNRASATPLKERQAHALQTYDLDAALLDSATEAGGKVELLVCNLAEENLGLSSAVYGEIQQSVTVIINNAWALNFKAPLAKFEPLLKGLRNLVQLSLSSPRTSPPILAFVSTVLVWWNYPSGKAKPETLLSDPTIAIHSGYSESKWIAETLLGRFALSHGLPVTIIRLGQLIGDSNTGSWNMDEWIPAVIKLSQHRKIHSVPLFTQITRSIAPDLAAQVVLDMVSLNDSERTSVAAVNPENPRVLQLVHPTATPASVFTSALCTIMNLPALPAPAWLNALRSLAQSANSSQLQAMLVFLEQALPALEYEFHFEYAKALESSRTMRALLERPSLSEEDVRRWVNWLKKREGERKARL